MTDKSLHISVVGMWYKITLKRLKMMSGNQFSFLLIYLSKVYKTPASLNHLILSIDNIFLLIYYYTFPLGWEILRTSNKDIK